jgi:hypothetical protein
VSQEENPFDRTIFIPSWLVRCLNTPNAQTSKNVDMSCCNWTPMELKALALVLSGLQEKCLGETSQEKSFSLNREELTAELTFSVFRKEHQVTAFFNQLGGLRIYLEKERAEEKRAKPFFYKETQNPESLHFWLSEEMKEVLFGVSSSVSRFYQQVQKPFTPRFSHEEAPLAFKKSLWLEINPYDLGNFLALEKGSLYEENLAYIPLAFTQDLESLPLFSITERDRKKNLLKRVKKLNNLLKKASFHGVTEAVSSKEICWLPSANHKILSLWQKKENLEVPPLGLYYERVNGYFLRLGLEKLSLFFHFFEQENKFKLYHEELTKHLSNYEKDFELSENFSELIPLVFIFLEISLRLQSKKFPLGEELKAQIEKDFKEEKNFFDLYKEFRNLYKKTAYLKRLLLKDSFLLNTKHPFYEDKGFMEKLNTISLSSKKEVRNADTLEPETKTPAFKEEIITKDPEVKTMIGDALLKLKAHSKGDYQKIKSLYYNSLNEKSQNIIRTLEQRMNQTVFEHQLDQRLIHFVLNNQGNPVLGSLGKFSQNISQQ